MVAIINTNINSLITQRALNRATRENDLVLEQLASGLRINGAKDDPAGLAISERFDIQLRGLTVAIRNAGDGVSLAQTGEGAVTSMIANLSRIRDLALQAANESNSDLDRQALNQEVQALIAETQRIADQTNFNGRNLLDGTFQNIRFQIGANIGETLSVSITGASISTLGTALTDGISSLPVAFPTGAATPADAFALNSGDLIINGNAVPPATASDDTASSQDNAKSAIAKAAAINTIALETGVTAVVPPNVVGGTAYTSSTANDTITLNGVNITLSTFATSVEEANLESVVEAINTVSGQTGVEASFTGEAGGGVTLTAEDGRNIVLEAGALNTTNFGLASVSPGDATTFVGAVTLISRDGTQIEVASDTGNIANAGLQVGTFSGSNSGAISGAQNDQPLASGDLVINGVAIGSSRSSDDTASVFNPAASAIAKAEAINRSSSITGVSAEVNPAVLSSNLLGSIGSDTAGSFDVNGVPVNVAWSATDTTSQVLRTLVNAVNAKSEQTGVTAEAIGNTFRLVAEDGRNIVVDNPASLSLADIGLGTTNSAAGSITLLSAGKIEISTNTGDITNSGFGTGTFGAEDDGQLIKDLDISTVSGANLAVIAVDNALETLNFQRSLLGAIQNRFETTIVNQEVVSENLSAANSRIRDADFAELAAELARTQTLQSAGISILAQANANQEQVLQLLQS